MNAPIRDLFYGWILIAIVAIAAGLLLGCNSFGQLPLSSPGTGGPALSDTPNVRVIMFPRATQMHGGLAQDVNAGPLEMRPFGERRRDGVILVDNPSLHATLVVVRCRRGWQFDACIAPRMSQPIEHRFTESDVNDQPCSVTTWREVPQCH